MRWLELSNVGEQPIVTKQLLQHTLTDDYILHSGSTNRTSALIWTQGHFRKGATGVKGNCLKPKTFCLGKMRLQANTHWPKRKHH